MKHVIIVGNVGTVFDETADDIQVAQQQYAEWVNISLSGVGRAGNEPVTWFIDGEPYMEHDPVQDVPGPRLILNDSTPDDPILVYHWDTENGEITTLFLMDVAKEFGVEFTSATYRDELGIEEIAYDLARTIVKQATHHNGIPIPWWWVWCEMESFPGFEVYDARTIPKDTTLSVESITAGDIVSMHTKNNQDEEN